ncbi:MAG TPA: potassium channel family protein [Polyangiaceae bacterium]|nr:potassium channel family protein [Polyangiaceae bacterium]
MKDELRSSRVLRLRFLRELWAALTIVWPIISALLLGVAGLGVAIGYLEGWKLGESLYFAFVSGLTIGYGDLAPARPLGRVLAVGIGFIGVLLTALLGAVGVQALIRARSGE